MKRSKHLVSVAADTDPYGWRVGAGRILANALLALLAYELASVLVGAIRMIVAAAPAGPVEAWLLMPAFLLVRWIFVLPGLLPVLIAIEYVARRAPQARVLTGIVAFVPMAWWQLTQSSGDTSGFNAVLGVTAVLFAVAARLPDNPRRSVGDRRRAQPPSGPALCPRPSLIRAAEAAIASCDPTVAE